MKLVPANVMPAVSAKMGASMMHSTIQKAPPAGDTPGAVLQPIQEGTEVDAAQRKKKPAKDDDREEQRA